MTRRQRMMEDHDGLERDLEGLSAQAFDCDWENVEAVWDAFVEHLEAHMRFEETELLGRLEQRDVVTAQLAEELEDEHAAFRRLCDRIGIDIQRHQVRSTALDDLAGRLRRHAQKENELLYGSCF